jgi:mannitol/fructose-specific phosphotransferase system IIA component (Ntr-type)
MDLSKLLREDCVHLGMPPLSKEETIRSMVDLLTRAGQIESPAQVVRALMERERVMSTGVGGGVALPHALSPGARQFAVTFARPRTPIDFDAIDGQPVNEIFLVVGPEDRTVLMKILTRISRLLYGGELQKKILKVKTPADFIRLIAAEEARIGS